MDEYDGEIDDLRKELEVRPMVAVRFNTSRSYRLATGSVRAHFLYIRFMELSDLGRLYGYHTALLCAPATF